jgi:RNA polymerase sigma factor (sigma-70 family)
MNGVARILSFPDRDIGDAEAIDHVLGGNREMFEVIVRRYNPRLFRVGMAYLRGHAQAEDAMQNAYVKAFFKLRTFRRGSAFSTWLTRIMINECLMALRTRRKASENVVGLDRASSRIAAPQTTDELSLKEMKALLEQAVGALPRKCRMVYLLREGQQMNTAQTAACLGLSHGDVKVSLHRARERLKAGLLRSAAGVELFSYPAIYCDAMTERVLRAVLGSA